MLTYKSWIHSFDPAMKWQCGEWCFFIATWRKTAGCNYNALIKVTCGRVVFDHLATMCYMPDLKITTTAHINAIVICYTCCGAHCSFSWDLYTQGLLRLSDGAISEFSLWMIWACDIPYCWVECSVSLDLFAPLMGQKLWFFVSVCCPWCVLIICRRLLKSVLV